MDDAGGGRRGPRAVPGADLMALLSHDWAVVPFRGVKDLGGSANLNLLVSDERAQLVVRVYRPFATPERLAVLQHARRSLALQGLPVTVPIPTLAGASWSWLGDRLVEVERFIPSTTRMNTFTLLEAALPVLARVHSVLAQLHLGAGSPEPEFTNYVAHEGLISQVAVGTRRIRGWEPTPEESLLADIADRMAESVTTLHEQCGDAVGRQLVNGDFWDNNVLFRDNAVAIIGDFDFLGERPRVDDLALTLYFTSQDVVDLAEDPAKLRALITAYESGLDVPLMEVEREAIPIAMARQPLWSIAVWVALLDDEATARRHLAGTASALRWGMRLTETLLRR